MKLNRRTIASTFLIILAVLAMSLFLVAIGQAPNFRVIKRNFTSSYRAVLDRRGLILDEVPVNERVRRLAWVRVDRVPPPIIGTLLVAEDKRFFYHPGFDPFAMIGHPFRGDGTITMQVIELIESSNGISHPRRGMFEKLKQIGKAIVLEIKWRKSEILEAYINLVRFRYELQGLAAASYGLFDKSPAELTQPEGAVLAALIRAPKANLKPVRSRACEFLKRLGRPEECGLLTEEHLNYIEQGYSIRPFVRLAPQVAQNLTERLHVKDTPWIRSTLDRQLQWTVFHALQKRQWDDAAAVVLENETGDVLGYVGHIGRVRSPKEDMALSPHPAGSTLKPFIYAGTLEERILTAASTLEDSAVALQAMLGSHRPKHFHSAVREPVTLRAAMVRGLNIPAVRALELYGVDNFVQTMTRLGFRDLERPEFYGPSLALGSADVKLVELANAYRTLANGGLWSPIRFSPDETSDQTVRRVFSEDSTFVIKDLLSSRGDAASTRYWTASQAGGDQSRGEDLYVGFSEKFTVAVWARVQTGEASAVLAWREIMNALHRGQTSEAPRSPTGLAKSGDEWFLKGTEPVDDEIPSSVELPSRFSFPVNQTMVDLDQGGPTFQRRQFIQIVAPRSDQNVYLNGRRLGRATALLPWRPVTGRYVLELRNSKGVVMDRVKFEVRGRNFASAP